MEIVEFNKKQRKIKITKMNILLLKKESEYNFDDIESIHMLYKGHERRSSDTRRYFIQLQLKDKEVIFGECLSYRKIEEKYKICLALLFDKIMREVDKSYLIDKTTSIREDSIYTSKKFKFN